MYIHRPFSLDKQHFWSTDFTFGSLYSANHPFWTLYTEKIIQSAFCTVIVIYSVFSTVLIIHSELKTLECDILNPDLLTFLEINSYGEQAIFNLDIKKKFGLSINPDIHHSKVDCSPHEFNLQKSQQIGIKDITF